MIVLDTNVLSELMRPAPAPTVIAWLDAASSGELIATTAITVAEILYGIERLPDGRRKQQLGEIAAAMFEEDFADAILAFDAQAAVFYAERVAASEAAGHPCAMADAQIAALCAQHDATLATRNTKDFRSLGVALINPWEDG
ncbi:type II toxin-antitoxin system VapC family toxin [Salinisphaera sp.]|uniref:type II toxin-antitoxin system VapC family toxin n=1 Tax=Salinisphaera sp. TaxID=1914330 RepID=UPI000C52CC4D|nr:type II toxin-antitoxin system VapC family toxin [Salinisphaera sp.]MBS62572.1 VapC toxin family PIN domain ribonuclease [Salinisphaera sp.]